MAILLTTTALATPALAAKHHPSATPRPKPTGACAQSAGRCIGDCDQLNWCTMYACVNGQSTRMSFWRCFEPSGLCLAPHC